MTSATISDILNAKIETTETGLSLFGQIAGAHPRKEQTPGWGLQSTHVIMRLLIEARETFVVALLRHERYSWSAVSEFIAGGLDVERTRQALHQQYATRVDTLLAGLGDLTPQGRTEAIKVAGWEEQIYQAAISDLNRLLGEDAEGSDPEEILNLALTALATVMQLKEPSTGPTEATATVPLRQAVTALLPTP